MELINNLVNYATNLLQDGGIIFGVLLILFESIIPMLPLGAFIVLNINAFGLVLGMIISHLATCLGCYLSFMIFSKLSKIVLPKFVKRKKYKKIIDKMSNINFSNLVVLIALPFTPAFLINITSGLVDMAKKKFIIAIVIGKIFIIIFWSFVGKSFLESITDIKTIFIISTFIIIAYFISKIIGKKMDIE